MNAPVRLVAPAPVEMTSTIVERGCYRVVVGEHPEAVYIAVGNGRGDSCAFLDPRMALDVAAALISAAAKATERQFQRQLGSPPCP